MAVWKCRCRVNSGLRCWVLWGWRGGWQSGGWRCGVSGVCAAMWRGDDAGDWHCGLGEALQSELGVVAIRWWVLMWWHGSYGGAGGGGVARFEGKPHTALSLTAAH